MKKLIFHVGMVFLLVSCNSGNKVSSEASSDGKSEKKASITDSKSYDCLKKFEDDYSLLLTKEEMNSVYPINPDKNKKELRSGSFYSDKSDMKSNIETFDMGYKELSEKELEQINDNLAKQDDEIKKTGKDLMKVRAKSSWEFIENLGSSAWYKWNEQWGGELVVLAGKSNFTILAKTSSDPVENREIAKKLAKKVLSKCK